MNKVLALNSADYKFIDWLNTYQSKVPTQFLGEDWYRKAKKLKTFIEENSLEESVTFSDPRLIAVAFEMMMRLGNRVQSRLVNWFILREYLHTYELQDSEEINTYKEWVDSYMAYNFTDARPEEEVLAEYNAKAEYILQSGINDIIPEFVEHELSANVKVEQVEEEAEDVELLKEVSRIMLKYTKGSVKKEWQSLLDSLSVKMKRGGEIVTSKDSISLIKESVLNGSRKIKVEFFPAYNPKEHKIVSDELKNMLKIPKISIFDLKDDDDFFMIVDLLKNPKDVKKITWVKEYEKGGSFEDENRQMVLNQNKQIKHHTEELPNAVKKSKHVPAWVVAKVNRSANDISDATHYLDGEDQYKTGGNMTNKWFKN